jgi:hypothetical protein
MNLSLKDAHINSCYLLSRFCFCNIYSFAIYIGTVKSNLVLILQQFFVAFVSVSVSRHFIYSLQTILRENGKHFERNLLEHGKPLETIKWKSLVALVAISDIIIHKKPLCIRIIKTEQYRM